MRNRRWALLGIPLAMLAFGCSDQQITAPPDPLLSSTTGEGPSYEIIVLNGSQGQAHAINDAGVIAGNFRNLDNLNRAAKWAIDESGS